MLLNDEISSALIGEAQAKLGEVTQIEISLSMLADAINGVALRLGIKPAYSRERLSGYKSKNNGKLVSCRQFSLISFAAKTEPVAMFETLSDRCTPRTEIDQLSRPILKDAIRIVSKSFVQP
jgi:hypothetical protein